VAITVREATADDLDAMIDVQQAGAIAGLAHIFPQDRYPFPREALRRRWAEELDDPDTRVYVGVDEEGAVTGFAATRGNELLHFGTALPTWGTGTAGYLHAELLVRLAETVPAGISHVRLRVFDANTGARRFYEKLGWSTTDRCSRSAFPPTAVLVEYQRPLDEPRDPGG
jgi:RimJ/RimL family protein N-acetyltransferase